MGFRTLLQTPFACFNYQTARSDGICLFVVRWWLEFAPEVPDSCQVYPKAVGNLSLPWCAPCCLSYAAVLHVLVKRWRSAEAELDKSRLLGDEEKQTCLLPLGLKLLCMDTYLCWKTSSVHTMKRIGCARCMSTAKTSTQPGCAAY